MNILVVHRSWMWAGGFGATNAVVLTAWPFEYTVWLYLRDFDPENRSVILSTGTAVSVEVETDYLASALARAIGQYLPVFGLDNARQVLDPKIRRVAVDDENLFGKFSLYATHACLLILNVKDLSPSVRDELGWIFENKHGQKTLFIGPIELI